MRLLVLAWLLCLAAPASAQQRIGICDRSNSPRTSLRWGAWAFCDADHWLTENEFVRTYRQVTGLHDLDSHERDRKLYRWIAGGVLGAAGLGTMIYGFATLERPCTLNDRFSMQCFGPKATLIPTNTVLDSTSATVGAIGLAAVIAAAVIMALPPGHDGKATDHDLNRFAAELALRRYEEARTTRYHTVPRPPPAEKLGPSENDD